MPRGWKPSLAFVSQGPSRHPVLEVRGLPGWGTQEAEGSCPLLRSVSASPAAGPAALVLHSRHLLLFPPSPGSDHEAQLTGGPRRWPSPPAGTRAGCECDA